MPIAVLTSHFNPAGWMASSRNLLRLMRQMEAEGVPLFVAELEYGAADFLLPEAPTVLQVRTDLRNVLWHKENLLNLLERVVHEEFDRLIWVDGDVWFERLDWLPATEEGLENHAVAQPYGTAVWTDGRGVPGKARNSSAMRGGFAGHCGFAWAARRSLWRTGPGLFEMGIIGGADAMMMTAWLHTEDNMDWMRYPESAAWKTAARQWMQAEGAGCGYVEGTLWHEWHGETGDRDYMGRHEHLRGLDIARQVRRNPGSGVLEFAEDVPAEVRRGIRQYYFSRREDASVMAEAERAREAAQLSPWMAEEELAVIADRIRPGNRMLEFGSGGSTLWLAVRVRELHSVEHNQNWAARILPLLPENATLHWRRPGWELAGTVPAEPGQFSHYLDVPDQLGLEYDACLIDGCARVDAAVRAVRWLKHGGWLFFHDWFARQRYAGQMDRMVEYYEFCEEMCVRTSRQTLAVFRRRQTSPAGSLPSPTSDRHSTLP